MKFTRIHAIVLSGIVAASAAVGIAGSGPASAAPYSHLCIDSSTYKTNCADSLYGLGSYVAMVSTSQPSLTNWTVPSVGTSGAIRQADNVNYCMQISAVSAPAYIVQGGSCTADAAEQWKNYYIGGRTVFESIWGTEHNMKLCLGFNAGMYAVTAAACDPDNGATQWYQEWGSS